MSFDRAHRLSEREVVELESPHEALSRPEDRSGRGRQHSRIGLNFLEDAGVFADFLIVERHTVIAGGAYDSGERPELNERSSFGELAGTRRFVRRDSVESHRGYRSLRHLRNARSNPPSASCTTSMVQKP